VYGGSAYRNAFMYTEHRKWWKCIDDPEGFEPCSAFMFLIYATSEKSILPHLSGVLNHFTDFSEI
jgi:hypothetical protein